MRDLFLVRTIILICGLPLLILSQIYWFRLCWGLTSRAGQLQSRILMRGFCSVAFGLVFLAILLNFRVSPGRPWRSSMVTAIVGLWVTSALFGYLAVQAVAL